ncbi:hypothetical protein [Acinetobacter sp. ABJ_C5_2]|uniref:hypothetical protein n=1 Tax=Acinetobacter sp. ABJ_C5_2 TaxID=3376992 RepID=UPI0037C552C8
MKLEQIETADMDVKSIKIYKDNIYILFLTVYDTCLKKYIKNVELVFSNWSSFTLEKYDSTIEEYKQFDLLEINRSKEFFTLIQIINIFEDVIELEGFNNDGEWNKVIIFNPSYKLNVINIDNFQTNIL